MAACYQSYKLLTHLTNNVFFPTNERRVVLYTHTKHSLLSILHTHVKLKPEKQFSQCAKCTTLQITHSYTVPTTQNISSKIEPMEVLS